MQKKYSFDAVTLSKIGKSALLLVFGTMLGYIGTRVTEILTAFSLPAEGQVILAAFLTFVINAVREYIKGEEAQIEDGNPPTTIPPTNLGV